MTPCELCKGACCESIVFGPQSNDPKDNASFNRWLHLRGAKPFPGGSMELDCKCSKLKAGRCSIYDSRPLVCSSFEVGGVACRATVLQRRPHNAAAIFKLMKNNAG